MADKTTTLKTKTGVNVYPNIIGTNRKDGFADSSTIKHYYYDKTHKVGFQLANETNKKIQNSLQKPVGLTKTELVGVGPNGQENIEIGDNLTLANGKLSATGGGNSINILIGSAPEASEDVYKGTYSGLIDNSKINILRIDDFGDFVITYVVGTEGVGYVGIDADSNAIVVVSEGKYTLGFVSVKNPINGITIGDEEGTFRGTLISSGLTLFINKVSGQNFYVTIPIASFGLYGVGLSFNDEKNELTVYNFYESSKKYEIKKYYLKNYSHFITMTNSTDNVALYITIQNVDETAFTADTLVSYLAGKKVLANGNLHGAVPAYIAGEGGSIKVYYMTPGDSNINPNPDVYGDLSSFAISDLVTPVE